MGGIQPLLKQSLGKVGNSGCISGIRTAVGNSGKNRMLRNDRGCADDGEPASLQRIAQFQQRILIGPVAIDDDRHRRSIYRAGRHG